MIDKEEVLKKVKKFRGNRVLLQFPEGLKREALRIADFLEEKGYRVGIWGEYTFGACDIPLTKDIVVHFGHSKIFDFEKVTYVEVFDSHDFLPVLEKNLKKIPKKVGLVTTVQHVKEIPKVKKFLESKGIEVFVSRGNSRVKYEGQVLGCNFSSAKSIINKVDAFLYLGTGYFHPIGVFLATKKKVFKVFEDFEDVLQDAGRLLRQRHAQIFKAKNSENFGILVSKKIGQYRMKEARDVKKYLEKRGKKAYIVLMDYIEEKKLLGFGFDCYVVCACPRIAIDDFRMFEKPILTPREVRLLFEDIEYEMDELN